MNDGGQGLHLHLDPEPDQEPAEEKPRGPEHLSPRQREVLALLTNGWSNEEIAMALGLATPTVKVHLSAAMWHLGARNRVHAAVMAYRLGILP